TLPHRIRKDPQEQHQKISVHHVGAGEIKPRDRLHAPAATTAAGDFCAETAICRLQNAKIGNKMVPKLGVIKSQNRE
ncbi:MAG: hypothetical protein K2I62_02555, partial [Alistipes sp.]|nr:hypothetical protein [Alistipes sp.]